MDVEQTPLPGIGARYDFRTEDGRSVGVVARRDGGLELLVYAADDADQVSECVRLGPVERRTLAELLAVPPGEDVEGRTHHRVWRLTEDTP